MRKIADQLMSGFGKGGNARYQRLAVLQFTETGAEAKKRELGAVVTAELSTSLRRDHGVLLVERQKLQQVMGEIKLGQSGAVDAASAPEIGKLADAQALVLGSVAEAGDRYLIDARIVSTETAETLAAASEAVPAANLVALSSDAVVQAAAESLRTKAESRYTVRNVAIGVAASLWLLNILDAYFSGIDGDKLIGAPRAWVAPAPGGLSGGVAWAKRF